MARAGVASRRASEQIILDGRVKVNGTTVTELGTKVSPEDKISVDDKLISLEETKRYVLLNKPAGYVCTMSDEKGRPIASDLLKSEFTERLYNVGRLDMFSTGAILFTNDGDFAHWVISPKSGIVKTYHAVTEGTVNAHDAAAFKVGITLADGTKCLPAELILQSDGSCIVKVMEGKYHQVKRMLAACGKPVKELSRLAIGSVELDSSLKSGDFRPLSEDELCRLMKKK